MLHISMSSGIKRPFRDLGRNSNMSSSQNENKIIVLGRVLSSDQKKGGEPCRPR
jgi:hypothetical protein